MESDHQSICIPACFDWELSVMDQHQTVHVVVESLPPNQSSESVSSSSVVVSGIGTQDGKRKRGRRPKNDPDFYKSDASIQLAPIGTLNGPSDFVRRGGRANKGKPPVKFEPELVETRKRRTNTQVELESLTKKNGSVVQVKTEPAEDGDYGRQPKTAAKTLTSTATSGPSAKPATSTRTNKPDVCVNLVVKNKDCLPHLGDVGMYVMYFCRKCIFHSKKLSDVTHHLENDAHTGAVIRKETIVPELDKIAAQEVEKHGQEAATGEECGVHIQSAEAAEKLDGEHNYAEGNEENDDAELGYLDEADEAAEEEIAENCEEEDQLESDILQRWKCPECPHTVIYSEVELEQHAACHGPSRRGLLHCAICKESGRRKCLQGFDWHRLKVHIGVVHKINFEIGCRKCDEVFALHREFMKHYRSHRLKCIHTFCRYDASTQEDLDVHMKCHQARDPRSYYCFKCGYICKNRMFKWSTVHAHLVVQHPGTISALYTCINCQRGFQEIRRYREHKRKCVGDTIIECELCEKKIQKCELVAHALLHIKEAQPGTAVNSSSERPESAVQPVAVPSSLSDTATDQPMSDASKEETSAANILTELAKGGTNSLQNAPVATGVPLPVQTDVQPEETVTAMECDMPEGTVPQVTEATYLDENGEQVTVEVHTMTMNQFMNNPNVQYVDENNQPVVYYEGTVAGNDEVSFSQLLHEAQDTLVADDGITEVAYTQEEKAGNTDGAVVQEFAESSAAEQPLVEAVPPATSNEQTTDPQTQEKTSSSDRTLQELGTVGTSNQLNDESGIGTAAVSEEGQYRCEKHDLVFTNKLDLTNHYVKVHWEIQLDALKTEPVSLPMGKRPRGRPPGSTNRNRPDGNQKALFKCKHCYKRFFFEERLNKHYKRAHPDDKLKRVLCQTCGKDFRNRAQFRNHYRTVHEGKKRKKPAIPYSERRKFYVCELCGYTTPESVRLRNHKLSTHDGVMPYMCNLCDYKTNEKSDMRRHQHKHAGIKRYSCAFCNYKSDQRWLLVNHCSRQHGVELPKVSRDTRGGFWSNRRKRKELEEEGMEVEVEMIEGVEQPDAANAVTLQSFLNIDQTGEEVTVLMAEDYITEQTISVKEEEIAVEALQGEQVTEEVVYVREDGTVLEPEEAALMLLAAQHPVQVEANVEYS